MATARSSSVTSRSGSRVPTWSAKRSVTRPGSRMRSGRTFAGAPTGARACGAVQVDASGCRRPPPLSPVQSSPPASGTWASTRPPKVIAPTLDRQLDCQLPPPPLPAARPSGRAPVGFRPPDSAQPLAEPVRTQWARRAATEAPGFLLRALEAEPRIARSVSPEVWATLINADVRSVRERALACLPRRVE